MTSFLIITIFNGLDRTLGFLFKIFLSREMGAANMGVYQIATSVYLVLLTLITSGIPLVVSKKTAKALSLNDNDGAASITTAALIVGIITAVTAIAATFIAYYPLKTAIGKDATHMIMVLAPSLLFAAVYSALRGNLWGREKYFAVSIVEVIEQVARILCCVILFFSGTDKLMSSALCMTVGCFVSAAACAMFFFFSGGRLRRAKGFFKPILSSQLPITLSKAAGSLVSSLLSVIVPALFILSGYTEQKAYAMYGSSAGMALPLLYTPLTVIGALAFVLIPSIGSCADKGKNDKVNEQAVSSIEFSIMVACAFVPLFLICGKEIGEIVYNDTDSGLFMSISAWILLPLSIEAITSSIMNSLDLEMRSLINSMIGYAVQAVIYVICMKSFTLEIYALGIGASLVVASVLHIAAITKKTGLPLSFLKTAVIYVLIVIPSSLLTKTILGIFSFLAPLPAVIISGSAGIAAFIVLSWIFGGLDSINLGIGKKKNNSVTQ